MKKMIFALAAVLLLSGCAGSTESKIINLDDEALRKISSEVEKITNEELEIIENLKKQLEEQKTDGIAAPQIGVNKRIMLINDNVNKKLLIMINPKIISSEGQTIDIEHSTIIPGLYATVKRSNKLQVEFQNERGKIDTIKTEGKLSRTIQHFNDHLNGILFYDAAENLFYKE